MSDHAGSPGGGFWADADGEHALDRYATLVNMVDDGIYQLDAEGRFVAVNDTIVELTGYSREDLLGEHASLVLADEDASRIQREIYQRLTDDDRRDESLEFTARTVDGDTVPCELELHLLVEDGTFEGTIGVVRDVTERKRRERELEESERRYRTLVENFPGAVALLDENLEFTAGGGQYFEKTDVSLDERVGHSIHEVYPADLVETLEPKYRNALDGEASEFEVEFNDRHLHVQTLPVRNADDEVDSGMIVAQDVTARREYQHRLEESEAKFRMVAENIEETVWMTTPDTDEFLYVNPAYEEVFGQDPETLYEDPYAFEELLHPEDRERVLEEWNKLPEEPYEEEFRIVRPDGETRWVHVQATRIHDESGGVSRIVGVVNDVTERVEREHELERALDLLNKAERIADVAGWEVDPDTKEPYWSDHLFDILDVDYDEQPSLDQALSVYHSEDDRAIVEDAVTEALETGASFDVEARFPRPSGDVGWLRVKGEPEVESGEVVTLRGAVQDVTEQKERERELRESRNELQALIDDVLDTSDVGTFVLDSNFEVVWINQATERYFGLDREAVVGRNKRRLIEEEIAPIFEAPDRFTERVTATYDDNTYTEEFECHVVGDDTREERWLNHWSQPIESGLYAGGRIEHYTDITEQIKREHELEESNERLQQFAYAASHDLQEPLRMVTSYLKLIEDRYADDLDEDGEEFIEFAVDGADRMREMIEGLLEYSRVETRGDPFEPVDLDDVLSDVRDDLQVKIEESDAEVTAGDLPRVEADAGQLRQVFQNLLDNALEYSGDEPPRIHVSAERDGAEWVVSISDEGIGIDRDQTDDVFEVFQRLHAQDEHAGTGIGLALCERIVERHGGEIWVDSEPGEGATFSFTLPAIDS